MHIKIFFQFESFPAVWKITYPLFFLRMCLLVSFQRAFLYKFLATDIATEGPFPGVSPRVSRKRPSTWELCRTKLLKGHQSMFLAFKPLRQPGYMQCNTSPVSSSLSSMDESYSSPCGCPLWKFDLSPILLDDFKILFSCCRLTSGFKWSLFQDPGNLDSITTLSKSLHNQEVLVFSQKNRHQTNSKSEFPSFWTIPITNNDHKKSWSTSPFCGLFGEIFTNHQFNYGLSFWNAWNALKPTKIDGKAKCVTAEANRFAEIEKVERDSFSISRSCQRPL